jgi:hypothetical protein
MRTSLPVQVWAETPWVKRVAAIESQGSEGVCMTLGEDC